MWHRHRLFSLFLVFLMAIPASAQLGGLAGLGKKKDQPAKASDKPPEYSEKDKAKMAEIAQRPEIKEAIESAWQEIRRHDMDLAYQVNQSVRYAPKGGLELAKMRNDYGQIYDNPILQQYLNALGQKLVPKDSPNLYAFRLLLDPEPRAEAISTGSIYVSTGLVSLLDNEAQLAYILRHEIAHVERNHFYNKLRDTIVEQALYADKEADVAKKRALFSLGATLAGGLIGGAAGGARGAIAGIGIGYVGGEIGGSYLYRNKFVPTEWATVFEDEADEAGMKYMLDVNYDGREIPRLYANVDRMVGRDARLGLGFIGSPARVKERTGHIQKLLAGAMKADIEAKMKSPGLIGATPEFPLMMAALKRDNGVIALDYDLFAMAKDNLEEAVQLRSNDPSAHYYLGKVYALTGRTPEDKQNATNHFLAAIKYDAQRGFYPEPHLEYALYLINQNNSQLQEDIKKELKSYVALFQREHAGALPANMNILYDYFLLAGDQRWYVPPAAVVSTKDVEPVNVFTLTEGRVPSTAAPEVLRRAGGAVMTDSAAPDRTEMKPAAIKEKPKTAAPPKK
jgi:hypothetical protein